MDKYLISRFCQEKFPLIIPLFPNIPPTINFLAPGAEYDPPLPQCLQEKKWNAPGEAVPIVLDCVRAAGYSVCQYQVRSGIHNWLKAERNCHVNEPSDLELLQSFPQ